MEWAESLADHPESTSERSSIQEWSAYWLATLDEQEAVIADAWGPLEDQLRLLNAMSRMLQSLACKRPQSYNNGVLA